MRHLGSTFLAAFSVATILWCCAAPSRDTGREADRIKDLSKKWLAAEIAKDVDTIVDLYADDAVEMPSNTPAIFGKEAIRQWYKGWLLDPSVVLTFSTAAVEVSASADLAYERGTYRFVKTGPEGKTEDVGKYVTIWKLVGGKWKVIADTNASDQPVPGT